MTKFDKLIYEIQISLNLSRGEARRWLTEEIDRRRRVFLQNDGFSPKKMKTDNPFRFIQNKTGIPKGSSKRPDRRTSKAGFSVHTPRLGTRTQITHAAILEFNGDRERVKEFLYDHPIFQGLSHKQIAGYIYTVSSRWQLPISLPSNAPQFKD